MNTTSPKTLFEAIAPRKAEFERIVYEGVHQGLIALGDDIRSLDWASLQAHLKSTRRAALTLAAAVTAAGVGQKMPFPLLFSNAAMRRAIGADDADEPSLGGGLG
jgi:hypothetical protein